MLSMEILQLNIDKNYKILQKKKICQINEKVQGPTKECRWISLFVQGNIKCFFLIIIRKNCVVEGLVRVN